MLSNGIRGHSDDKIEIDCFMAVRTHRRMNTGFVTQTDTV